MKIRDVVALIKGNVLCCEDKQDKEVYSACASDMMSDVLAYVREEGLLITGLNNPQVVRTAEMMDMSCIVLVSAKKPDATMLELARQKGIVFISTELSVFETSGILYNVGIKA